MLTDEKIFEIAEPFGAFQFGDAQGDKRLGFAHAIEAAATAPLLERIAELQKELCALSDQLAYGDPSAARLAQRVPRVPPYSVSKELIRLADIMRDCGRLVSSTGSAEKTLRIAASLLSAAPAAPEQQEPTSPCACRPGMMCNRSAACADEIRRDAQASNAQQAEAQELSMAIPQFRKPGSSNWYDGFPDYADGGGPYEIRALFTRPQPAQRPPLTIAEVEAIIARWSYELHGDRARFIVRETELAHGIG